MPRREVNPLKINHQQMAASHRRLNLWGFPHCVGESCVRQLDFVDFARQLGLTREEALAEILDLFKEPYLKGD